MVGHMWVASSTLERDGRWIHYGKKLIGQMVWIMFSFDMHPLFKHCYRPQTLLQGNGILWWQWSLFSKIMFSTALQTPLSKSPISVMSIVRLRHQQVVFLWHEMLSYLAIRCRQFTGTFRGQSTKIVCPKDLLWETSLQIILYTQ